MRTAALGAIVALALIATPVAAAADTGVSTLGDGSGLLDKYGVKYKLRKCKCKKCKCKKGTFCSKYKCKSCKCGGYKCSKCKCNKCKCKKGTFCSKYKCKKCKCKKCR